MREVKKEIYGRPTDYNQERKEASRDKKYGIRADRKEPEIPTVKISQDHHWQVNMAAKGSNLPRSTKQIEEQRGAVGGRDKYSMKEIEVPKKTELRSDHKLEPQGYGSRDNKYADYGVKDQHAVKNNNERRDYKREVVSGKQNADSLNSYGGVKHDARKQYDKYGR